LKQKTTTSAGLTFAIIILLVAGFSVAPSFAAASQWDEWDTVTSKATFNVRVDDGAAAATFAGMRDADGHLVFRAFTAGSTLYLTDGVTETGSARVMNVGTVDTVGWNQVAVALHGGSYTLHLNQADAWTLRTSVPATEGVLFVENAHAERLRFTLPEDSVDHVFTTPLAARGWSVHENGGSVQVEAPSQGFVGDGRLTVTGSGGSSDVTYASFPATDFDGRYHLAAAAQPTGIGHTVVPDHAAVLAGVSDTDAVTWAVTVGPAGVGTGWAFYVADTEGRVTQVSERYTTNAWHAVTASVDEAAGTLHVQVDGQGKHVFTGLDLLPAERIAVGDVWPHSAPDIRCALAPLAVAQCLTRPTGEGTLHVDDVIARGWAPGSP
jgi:hypothetical protein